MIQIVRDAERETWIERRHVFEWADMPGAGYGFEVGEDGTPTKPEHAAKLAECLVTPRLIDRGIETYERSYLHPAIGRCACGDEVVLSGFTNHCKRCGRDYNRDGAELAPRSQWGEETGESVGDILRIR